MTNSAYEHYGLYLSRPGQNREAVLADALGLHSTAAQGTMGRVSSVVMAKHPLTHAAEVALHGVLDIAQPAVYSNNFINIIFHAFSPPSITVLGSSRCESIGTVLRSDGLPGEDTSRTCSLEIGGDIRGAHSARDSLLQVFRAHLHLQTCTLSVPRDYCPSMDIHGLQEVNKSQVRSQRLKHLMPSSALVCKTTRHDTVTV